MTITDYYQRVEIQNLIIIEFLEKHRQQNHHGGSVKIIMADNHRNNISNECYSKSDRTSDHDTFDYEKKERVRFIRDITNDSKMKVGFTCSTFDLLHPGHVIMLDDSKQQCDILVVGIQTDPTLDRPDSKNKPIQSLKERKIMIESCKYVNHVIEYTTENDLYNILMELKPDIRILGSDWKGKQYTGYSIEDIEIYWHDRSGHKYSTSDLRHRVYMAELER